MKTFLPRGVLIPALAVVILTGAAVNLKAQIRETPATIGLNTGGNPQGFIQGSKPGAILFSTSQGVAGSEVPFSNIRGSGLDKLIRLEARSEMLANGRAAFSEGKFAEAAAEFGKIADNFSIILHIPQNFAAEARFYQIESLRRAGQFKAMAPLLETPAGKAIKTTLSDRYKKTSEFHKLWAVYGQGDMAKLEEELKPYQDPVVGKAKLLPTPNFKKAPLSELVQLSFMRASIFDSKGEKEKALQDYYRVFSFTYANEPFLAKQAMGKSMVIQGADPDLKSENERKRKAPEEAMQSLAYFFSKRFPGTAIPADLQQYVVRPDVEIMIAPKEEEEEEPKPEQPADGKGEDGKGKGKAAKTEQTKGKSSKKGKKPNKGKDKKGDDKKGDDKKGDDKKGDDKKGDDKKGDDKKGDDKKGQGKN